MKQFILSENWNDFKLKYKNKNKRILSDVLNS